MYKAPKILSHPLKFQSSRANTVLHTAQPTSPSIPVPPPLAEVATSPLASQTRPHSALLQFLIKETSPIKFWTASSMIRHTCHRGFLRRRYPPTPLWIRDLAMFMTHDLTTSRKCVLSLYYLKSTNPSTCNIRSDIHTRVARVLQSLITVQIATGAPLLPLPLVNNSATS